MEGHHMLFTEGNILCSLSEVTNWSENWLTTMSSKNICVQSNNSATAGL